MEEPVIRRPPQRVALLAHDRFGPFTSKTAIAVIRYGADDVVAVVDRSKMEADASEYIGRSGAGIPVVRSLSAAMAHRPEVLIFGWAPEGGDLPAHDRGEILDALRSGVDVISGLHTFLGDDEELVEAARETGARIVDLRRPPSRRRLVSGEGASVEATVVTVSGTDCSTGKMTVAVELVRAARRRGLEAAFVATGQSGMLIGCDAGAPVDAIPGDFMAGEVEAMVLEVAAKGPDLIVVEGQGALSHPAYGAVSQAVLQGSFPDAVVMCHDPGREVFKAFAGGMHQPRIPSIKQEIAMTEELLASTSKGRVVAVATIAVEEDAREDARDKAILRASLGLTVADVFRDGPDPLLDAVLARGRG